MKKTTTTFVLVGSLFMLHQNSVFSRENTGPGSSDKEKQLLLTGCSPATAMADLDINNVRARIISGGDMWWDLTNGKYEVPIGSGKNSLYAGALWIGGLDAGSQLKIAAQTYRQTGNDFYPGPLSAAGTIDSATCNSYDRVWKLNRADVISYHNWVIGGMAGPNPVSAAATQTILDWPATDPEGMTLAPYFDYNADGSYSPAAGDYPNFDIDGSALCDANLLYGDQMIWWVFNDKGNMHSETGGAAIGLEIRAQAFAFTAYNNTTFYTYKIINTSGTALNNTYFGQWVDPDLGSYNDDYIGCDVTRGLGYCYNGAAVDGIYGANPPAIGIDLLEGPFADPDLADNAVGDVPQSYSGYGDGIADNERLGMTKFVYYNNDASNYGNPVTATHFYNYMKGIWKDNTPITYGADGHSGSLNANYMYPGTSDPTGFGTGGTSAIPSVQAPWSELTVGNIPGDRRFLESSGPFTMQPGAVNTVTLDVVWAQASMGGPNASLQKLLIESDNAQMLFNNCFSPGIALGLADNAMSTLNVQLYPNPFTNNATISFENKNNESYQLVIYDMSGKCVRTYANVTGNSIAIARGELSTGTYIYKLSGSQTQATGKFIVK